MIGLSIYKVLKKFNCIYLSIYYRAVIPAFEGLVTIYSVVIIYTMASLTGIVLLYVFFSPSLSPDLSYFSL